MNNFLFYILNHNRVLEVVKEISRSVSIFIIIFIIIHSVDDKRLR